MGTIEATQAQVHDVEIAAAPDRIWAAITTAELTQRYGYGGSVEYDLRPGGSYRAIATPEMQAYGIPEVMVQGQVLEAEPARRLVQTWHPLFDGEIAAEGPTKLTWEIGPTAGGCSRLTVVHETGDAPRTAAIVSGSIPEAGGGWPYILRDLKALLETGDPVHQTVRDCADALER